MGRNTPSILINWKDVRSTECMNDISEIAFLKSSTKQLRDK